MARKTTEINFTVPTNFLREGVDAKQACALVEMTAYNAELDKLISSHAYDTYNAEIEKLSPSDSIFTCDLLSIEKAFTGKTLEFIKSERTYYEDVENKRDTARNAAGEYAETLSVTEKAWISILAKQCMKKAVELPISDEDIVAIGNAARIYYETDKEDLSTLEKTIARVAETMLNPDNHLFKRVKIKGVKKEDLKKLAAQFCGKGRSQKVQTYNCKTGHMENILVYDFQMNYTRRKEIERIVADYILIHLLVRNNIIPESAVKADKASK